MRGKSPLRPLLVIILLASPALLVAQVTVQDPGTYVVDKAGVIDPQTEQRLEALLVELHQKTTAQIKVLTVDTIGDEDWKGWTIRHAEAWKLGEKGKDNGVLIALTVNERKFRIENGYGLEGTLPDSWCGTVYRQIGTKYFKQGNYSEGLFQLTALTAKKVADDANVQLTGMPKMRTRNPGVFCGGGLFPIIVFFLIMSSISRRNRNYGRWGGGGLIEGMFWGSIMSSMLGGGRSHSSWGGGGGFGGGGFGGGGFGGGFGGGGSFGGGGGGGSW